MDQPDAADEIPTNPIELALKLRDSLIEWNRIDDHEGRFKDDVRLADALLHMLIGEGAGLSISKREVGDLVHARETLVAMRAADEVRPADVAEDAGALIDILDPLINRFFER